MPPGSVRELLQDLLRQDPGQPRVTWYGPGHERVELSARTLQNWVAKTANLLLEELDAEPGTSVGIDLPVHWRSVVWLLATWAVGGHAVVPARAGRLDVVVTSHVAAPPDVVAGALVVVSLPALATRYDGDLPPGAIDAATEVRLQPDAFPATGRPGPDLPALSTGGPAAPAATVTHGRLMGAASPTGARLLTDAGPQLALEAYLRPLLAGGSLVLHHDLAVLSTGEREHLVVQEAVTEVLATG